MFFRLLILISFLALTNCSNENKPYQLDLNLTEDINVIRCIKDAPTALQEYFAFPSDQSKFEPFLEAWDCIVKANKFIIHHLIGETGQDTEKFDRESFRRFINKNFFQDPRALASEGDKAPRTPPLSSELFKSFMEMKVFLVGGDVDFLTKEELSKLENDLKFLKTQIILLNPYMQIFLIDCSKKSRICAYEKPYIEKALKAIQKTGDNFSNYYKDHSRDFRLGVFQRFFVNFEQNYGGDWAGFYDFIPTFSAFKSILIAVEGDSVPASYVPVFLGQLFYFLSDYFEIATPIKGEERSDFNFDHEKTYVLVQKITNYIKQSFNKHENNIIQHKFLEKLIEELYVYIQRTNKKSKKDIDREVAIYKKSYRNFVEILLTPDTAKLKGGFDKESLDYLLSEYNQFHDFYDYVHVEFRDALCVGTGAQGFKEDYKHYIHCDTKLLQDKIGRFFLTQDKTISYDQKSLQFIAIYRSVVRIIMRAYSKKDLNELNFQGAKKLATDFEGVLILIGLFESTENVDSDSLDSAIKIFYDLTNLFLSKGNGDEALNRSESTTLLHYVLGLKPTIQAFFKDALEGCGDLATQTISETCFESIFEERGERSLSNLPFMLNYYKGLKDFQKGVLDEILISHTDPIPFLMRTIDNYKFSSPTNTASDTRSDISSASGEYQNYEVQRLKYRVSQNEDLNCGSYSFKNVRALCIELKKTQILIPTDHVLKLQNLPKIKKQFISYLANLIGGKDKEAIGESDLRNAFSTPFFVEVFLSRYDKDVNGVVSYEEALTSYPKFEPFIKKDIPISFANYLAPSAFTYIMYYGKKPGVFALLSWKWFREKKYAPQIAADRLGLIRILSSFN